MDEEAKEENPMQENSGAHFNQTFNTGVSPNPHFFSHDEISDFVEAGYDLNDLHFLQENNFSTQKTSIEMHAPKEIPRNFENEIEIPNTSETKYQLKIKIA